MKTWKKLLRIMRVPRGAEKEHPVAQGVWLTFSLTLLGICVGILALLFASESYPDLANEALFFSYFHKPLILVLNLLPPVLLIWLFYFITGRAWSAFLGSFLPSIGIALVNYYKIRLRSDPLLAVDLRLAAEAGNIVGGYTLDLNWLVWLALGCLLAGTLIAALLIGRKVRGWKPRLLGTAVFLGLTAASVPLLFTRTDVYKRADNPELINPWSDVEVFVSKGCLYPFLYSSRDMFPSPPEGYNEEEAAALLGQYEDADIPEERKVSVLGVMLEAFCDLTDLPLLKDQETVTQVYAPWHALEEQSVSGDLLTNIFAGGTVDTEWGFLTGYSAHDEFRRNTDSYVWYLKEQGYQTFGSHPGYGWFYNRQNVNAWLGFDEYWFTENHYGELVDPVGAIYYSDPLLADELLKQLKARVKEGPCFSFSVSYQNHGPYDSAKTGGTAFLTPAGTGMSEQSCNIFNNYLKGVSYTVEAMTGLAAGLEEMEEPVVLVLFGDHKPWAGNGNSAYAELGSLFDMSTEQGFREYYSTPYIIWANSAAKAVLQNDFTGDGGDFSPCFLMTRVFDLCGWKGPGFMELSRSVRDVTPLLHTQGLYLKEDGITDTLSEEDARVVNGFLGAEYYRENNVDPLERVPQSPS